MAVDKRVDQFGLATTPLALTDILPIVQGAGTAALQTTLQDIKDAVNDEFTVETTILSADVLTLNSTPIDLIPSPGIGFANLVTVAIFKIRTYGGTPYATNTTLGLVNDTSLTVINGFTERLANAGTCIWIPSFGVSMAAAHSNPTQLEENKKVQAYVFTGNPTAGNSDILIYLKYKIIPV